MIKVKVLGDYRKTRVFLEKAQSPKLEQLLQSYGEKGVISLSNATPKRSGKTARSWVYTVSKTKTGYKIDWSNTNKNQGTVIAILIQYGHGTRTGGFVQGTDYINPAMRQIFSSFADDIVAEVTKL